MKKLKSYMLVGIFLFTAANVFAQSDEAVEVESDVEKDQLKLSGVDKPAIKPRADYNPSSPTVKPSSSKKTALDNEPSLGIEDVESELTPAQNMPEEVNNEITRPDVITDSQMVDINTSLRKLIDDNVKLRNEIASLDEKLRVLRGQQSLDNKRFNEVSIERDALKKQNENIISLGSEAEKRLQTVQQELTQKEEEYNRQLVMLQTQLAQKLQTEQANAEAAAVFPSAATPDAKRSISVDLVSAPTTEEAKKRGEKVLLALNRLTDEKRKLVEDEAKIHYNMGNTFYNQGDYVNAASEYRKTLDLTPEDPNAHYNLAFVSDAYLNNSKVALIHYKKYLFYNPRADDAEMVEQKIIEAEAAVKGEVKFDSRIEEEIRKKKNEVNEMMSQ